MNIEMVRKVLIDDLAKSLVNVQPMNSPEFKDALRTLMSGGKSEAELKADGYKPVSRIGMLWIKDE